MNAIVRILAISTLLSGHLLADDTTKAPPADNPQSTQSSSQMDAISQVAGSLIQGVAKVQKDAHKKGDDLLKRTEKLLDVQEEQQKRFGKILDTWEKQQAQYQQYLDSLPKK